MMAVQNEPPYIGYLTVFRSRLGLCNLVLKCATGSSQPDSALEQRVRQVLEKKIQVSVESPSSGNVLSYLADKGLISGNAKASGRYPHLALTRRQDSWEVKFKGESKDSISVYQTDYWLAAGGVPSTIGAPTPDNLEEVLGLAFQLRFLTRGRSSWTTVGELAYQLRHSVWQGELVADPDNPFLLGLDSPVLLLAILEEDGLFLRELLRFLVGRTTVKRNEVADAMPAIAQAVLDKDERRRISTEHRRGGYEMVDRFRGAGGSSAGPGVREHRSSPRLEWLTDLGYLRKEHLPRNSFEYEVTAGVESLLSIIDDRVDSGTEWTTGAAIEAWRASDYWKWLRDPVRVTNPGPAIARAYSLVQRPIGPASLRSVAFLAGMFCQSLSSNELTSQVIALTSNLPGASISGGRYSSSPEGIYLSKESLELLKMNEE